MSELRATVNVAALNHIDETYRHSIQHLLLRSLALPSTIPADEANALKVQLQEMIRLVIDDLDGYLPDLQKQLIDDMRELGKMVAQVVRAYDEPIVLPVTHQAAEATSINLDSWSQSLHRN